MDQVPEVQKDALDQFDCKLLNPSLQKATDKRRKDQFKRLIAGCIGVRHAPAPSMLFGPQYRLSGLMHKQTTTLGDTG